VEFSYLDNLKGMKLIYTLFFLLSACLVSAQNDTIYPTKKIYKIGETIELVFKSKTGAMQLSTNGNCNAQLLYITQTLKPTGWPQVYVPEQQDCGLAYMQIPNGTRPFYSVNYTGTFRIILFSEQGMIFTDEYSVE
jgi:hypothetical protein